MSKKIELEQQIKKLVREWAIEADEHKSNQLKVQYSGPKFGPEEYEHMMEAIFSGWWSAGKFTLEAEEKLARVSERKHALLCNSGSSANLLLMAAAKQLYFKDGDKILTLACGFPTTVNPIVQVGLTPVFMDIDIDTLSIDINKFRKAIQIHTGIKGVFIPHTLSFPCPVKEMKAICDEYNVKLFFDACDAYATKYDGKLIQTFGDAATCSFYVAHHISCGEGGGIVTNDDRLNETIRGFRNWGRYCSAPQCCIRSKNPDLFCPGRKLTPNCDLPRDYMVNYQFEWIGYNLKMLELQGAILSKQLDRLDEFTQIRLENYRILMDACGNLPVKTWPIFSDEISPFAFPMLMSSNEERIKFVNFMTENNIETRYLFAGNLLKHPAYKQYNNFNYMLESLPMSDIIMNQFVMLGVSQINNKKKTEFVGNKIKEFFQREVK